MRRYIGITLAIAAGIVLAAVALKLVGIIDNDDSSSAAEAQIAYEKCVANLAPWRDPADYC